LFLSGILEIIEQPTCWSMRMSNREKEHFSELNLLSLRSSLSLSSNKPYNNMVLNTNNFHTPADVRRCLSFSAPSVELGRKNIPMGKQIWP